MRRVIWSDDAVESLERIAEYVEKFDMTAAAKLAVKLTAAIAEYVEKFDMAAAAKLAAKLTVAAASLAEFSDRSQSIGDGVRQMSIVRPYLIQYRVLDDEVSILRILHSARLREQH